MSGKKKKPKSKRDRVKNASLKKRFNARVRQEYIDADYLDKLSSEELDWYARFMAEDNNANFKHSGEKIIKDPETRKEIYNKNNARNRCMYSIAKARNLVYKADYDSLKEMIEQEQSTDQNYLEDAMIDYLDRDKKNSTDDEK